MPHVANASTVDKSTNIANALFSQRPTESSGVSFRDTLADASPSRESRPVEAATDPAGDRSADSRADLAKSSRSERSQSAERNESDTTDELADLDETTKQSEAKDTEQEDTEQEDTERDDIGDEAGDKKNGEQNADPTLTDPSDLIEDSDLIEVILKADQQVAEAARQQAGQAASALQGQGGTSNTTQVQALGNAQANAQSGNANPQNGDANAGNGQNNSSNTQQKAGNQQQALNVNAEAATATSDAGKQAEPTAPRTDAQPLQSVQPQTQPNLNSTQQPSAVQQPQTPPEVRFADQNIQNIAKVVKSQLMPDGGVLEMRLDPPQLGKITLMVVVKNGSVQASLLAANDKSADLLSHSLHRLQDALQQQGMNVERLKVELAPRDSHARQQGDPEANSQQQQAFEQRREQQRRELIKRMWAKLSGTDELNLVA